MKKIQHLLKKPDKKFIDSLPKTDLHVHLGGSLRPETMMEHATNKVRHFSSTQYREIRDFTKEYSAEQIIHLGHQKNLTYSLSDYICYLITLMGLKDLQKCVQFQGSVGSLEKYLMAFDYTESTLYSYENIRRCAMELCEDAAKENVRYIEIRFAPTNYIVHGIQAGEVVKAAVEGITQAEKLWNIKGRVILIGMKHRPESILETTNLVIQNINNKVVGFDLAGPERGYRPKDYRPYIYNLFKHYINITCHAGEAYGSKSINEAYKYLMVQRIGHGTRLMEDSALHNKFKNERLPIEMCLSSNVHTRSVNSYQTHPMRAFLQSGLRITINTDNRTVSGTNISKEMELAVKHLGMTKLDLLKLVINGAKAAFLDYEERCSLINVMENDILAILNKEEKEEYWVFLKNRRMRGRI